LRNFRGRSLTWRAGLISGKFVFGFSAVRVTTV
jgi:hypothetical protein